MSSQRDEAVERLLRRGAVPASGPPGTCLDAETVAAWFEGTLPPEARRAAEAHASACERCQAVLAMMAQSEPVPTRRSPASIVRWLVPVMAGLTALVIWINVRRPEPPVATPARQSVDAVAGAPRTLTAERPPAPATIGPESPSAEQRQLAQRAERKTGDQLSKVRPTTPSSANELMDRRASADAPAAPAAKQRDATTARVFEATPEQIAGGRRIFQGVTIASPSGAVWRVTGPDTIARSSDGSTWHTTRLDAPADLIAGSSPSDTVAWFAGKSGVVVRTVDGHTWQRSVLPEPLDIVNVVASDGRTATVTTADRRRFTTHDGGATWRPAPLQENPSAPF